MGANGEGKISFLDIITGKPTPDKRKVEWSRRVTVGYLDQRTALTKGKTIREVLREAFQRLYNLEAEMFQIYEKIGEVSVIHLALNVGNHSCEFLTISEHCDIIFLLSK